jgi:hypothetical protein
MRKKESIMKKVFAILLAVLILASLAACGNNAGTAKNEGGTGGNASDVISGGYTPADSPVVSAETEALLKKALENLDGADYIPVAYIASQIVAGKNHLILCKTAPVVAEPVYHYALVTIYEDLNDNAEITNVLESPVEAPAATDGEGNVLVGGWEEPETPVLTDEAKAALTKASGTLTGAEYEPVALLGEQIVAGTNYMILCKATPTVPNAESYYIIVTVYADLNGGAEIVNAIGFASDTATDESGDSASSQAE